MSESKSRDMITAAANFGPLQNTSRKTLLRKVTNNAALQSFTRADYELRQLKRIHAASKRCFKLLMQARTADSFATFSRELDRWIERERILLRIPLPHAGSTNGEKHAKSSPTVIEAQQTSALVMHPAPAYRVNGEAQPTASPGPSPAPSDKPSGT